MMDPQIQLIVTIASSFTTICVAIGWIVTIINTARKPQLDRNIRMDERVSKLEARMDAAEKFLAEDNKRLKLLESSMDTTMQSLLAIMGYLLDGSEANKELLRDAKEELQNHLVHRRSSL